MSRAKKSRTVGHSSVGLIQGSVDLHLRMKASPEEGQVKRIEFRSKRASRTRGAIHQLADQMREESNL